MMKKYSNQLIFDYINGNDIENYDLDTLENDQTFMIDVLNYTGDKKMFDFCGEQLKKDYSFIKFVVKKFKNDKRFIIKVAEEYLKEANDDEMTTKEFIFLMADLLPEYTEDAVVYDASIHYNLKREAFYDTIMMGIEDVLEKEKNPELGKGFIYFIDVYGTSEIIQNYIAKKYIQDIFYEDRNISLEKFLHRRFKSSRIIKEQGVIHFIINYIRCYDECVADYLTNHLELIRDLEKDISKVCNNWDSYMKDLNLNRVETFSYEIEKYLDEPSNMFLFSSMQIENYFIRKFHLESFYHNYYDKMGEKGKIVNPIYLDESYRIGDGPFTIKEYKCLQYMGVLAKKIFFDNTLSDVDYQDIIHDEEKHKKPSQGQKRIKKLSKLPKPVQSGE